MMERLAPHRDEIIALARELKQGDPDDGGAWFAVVRYFNDDDGEGEELAGESQLLGWTLESEVIRFLAEVDAVVGVDEYN
ncbi:hypothetical protein ACFXK0_22760 [Nocardia sp. NPDC059177]|uniref:hypothetical protein n=1 Tax=Nocardia sp. NPDC059177 TaxID=3346759 RepID=UPI0036A6449E